MQSKSDIEDIAFLLPYCTLTASIKTKIGQPYLMPKFMVSAVPIIPIANSMLLQILAACEKNVRNRVLHKYNIQKQQQEQQQMQS